MLSLSVVPTSVSVGGTVTIKVSAKNDISPQQTLILKTAVWKWRRWFWWIYRWEEVKAYPDVKLPPSDSTDQTYTYRTQERTRHKAKAGLYNIAGGAIQTAEKEFSAT
mgnify:CR=1 FL=1